MKKNLLYLALILTFNLTYGQVIINSPRTFKGDVSLPKLDVGVATDTILGINSLGKLFKSGKTIGDIGSGGGGASSLQTTTDLGATTTNPIAIGGAATPTGLLHIGDALSTRSSDPVINMRHTISDASGSGNAHGISDSNIITRGGNMAYASFDSRNVVLSGSNTHDHFASFQAAALFDTSGLIDEVYGFFITQTLNSTSSINKNFGLRVQDLAGAGVPVDNYGLWINPILKGTGTVRAIKTNGGIVEFRATTGGNGTDKEELYISRLSASLGDSQFIRWKAGSGLGAAIGDLFVLSNKHNLQIFGSSNGVKNLSYTGYYDGSSYFGSSPPSVAPSDLVTIAGSLNTTGTTLGNLYVSSATDADINTQGDDSLIPRGYADTRYSLKSSLVDVDLNIGDWDMTATANRLVAHGLSATEWKTVKKLGYILRDDLDTKRFTHHTEINISIDATNFDIFRIGAGIFDSTDYNATSYNRGTITYTYLPD